MTGEIKAIDRTTVHRICSGQVVLNLATAVKELVENSLDAGATVIDVKLREYGSELVEVTDNGSGVHPSNFEGLTLKHHTSKLRDFSDLISVETYGFRGEALSSLCALSELSVITRHESQECGTTLVFDRNGHISGCKPHARQMGTTVVLSNLFSSLPVRQKEFHRNLKKEFNKMTQLLYAYCLVSTGVRINCSNQGKKGVRTTFMATQGCKTVKENISCIFGAKQLNNLLEIKTKQPILEVIEELKLTTEDCKIFSLEGYISSCAHGAGRGANDRQFYYINSRPCEPSKVIKTVNEVYHQFNGHQYPFVFLNIRVSRDSVDVNVTPDKRQIFLAQEKLLSAIIKASLTDLFEKIPSTYSLNNIHSDKANSNLKDWRQSPKDQTPNFNRFNLWRHKSDGKRSCDSESDEGMRKQMKTESKQNVSSQKTLEKFKIQILHPEQTTKEESDHNRKTDSALINNSISNVNEENCKTEDVIEICSDVVIKSSELKSPPLEFKEELVDREESFANIVIKNSDDDELIVIKPTLGGNESDLNEAVEDVEEIFLIASDEVDVSSKLNNVEEENTTCVLLEKPQIPVELDVCEERDIKCIKTHINFDAIKNALTKRISQNDSSPNCVSVKFHAVIDPSKNELAEKELNREISKDMFEKMEIIGQFNLGFIITKLGSDLFIIDQHASDEKYNFETLQKTTTITNQKLVVPQTLELTAANEYILMDNMNVFKKNGFEFRIDESAPPTKRISLTALPMSRNWVFGKEDIDELIFMLQDSPGADCRPSRVRAMFASRACRRSVMIGTSLNKTEMRRLVNNMSTIEQPWNCPHGRPTMRHLVNLDLFN